jgi:hypothetical protein
MAARNNGHILLSQAAEDGYHLCSIVLRSIGLVCEKGDSIGIAREELSTEFIISFIIGVSLARVVLIIAVTQVRILFQRMNLKMLKTIEIRKVI